MSQISKCSVSFCFHFSLHYIITKFSLYNLSKHLFELSSGKCNFFMTHQELYSSLSQSLLLCHSASPLATRTGTHWNEMNPHLSLCHTEEKKKKKACHMVTFFIWSIWLHFFTWLVKYLKALNDVVNLTKNWVYKDWIQLQGGCCDPHHPFKKPHIVHPDHHSSPSWLMRKPPTLTQTSG